MKSVVAIGVMVVMMAMIVDRASAICVEGSQIACVNGSNPFTGVWDEEKGQCCFKDAVTCAPGTYDLCSTPPLQGAWSGSSCCFNTEVHCVESYNQVACESQNNPFYGTYTGAACCFSSPVTCANTNDTLACRGSDPSGNHVKGMFLGNGPNGNQCCFEGLSTCFRTDDITGCQGVNQSRVLNGSFIGEGDAGNLCCMVEEHPVTCVHGSEGYCTGAGGRPSRAEFIAPDNCCFPQEMTCVPGHEAECNSADLAFYVGPASTNGTCCYMGDVECVPGNSVESCGSLYHFSGVDKCCRYAPDEYEPIPVCDSLPQGSCDRSICECKHSCREDAVCPGSAASFGTCDDKGVLSFCNCLGENVGRDSVRKEQQEGCPTDQSGRVCSGRGICDKLPQSLGGGAVCTCDCEYDVDGVDDCSIKVGDEKICPGGITCSGNGVCDLHTGLCHCTQNFTGPDCGKSAMRHPQNETMYDDQFKLEPTAPVSCHTLTGCDRFFCECGQTCNSSSTTICRGFAHFSDCKIDEHGEAVGFCACRVDDPRVTQDIVKPTEYASDCPIGHNGLECSGNGKCMPYTDHNNHTRSYCYCFCPYSSSLSPDCSVIMESAIEPTPPHTPTPTSNQEDPAHGTPHPDSGSSNLPISGSEKYWLIPLISIAAVVVLAGAYLSRKKSNDYPSAAASPLLSERKNN